MRQVTQNPRHPQYDIFGGMGIQCHWPANSYQEFETWLINTLGHRPSLDHVLSRLDKFKDFAPGNLAWQIKKQSCRAHTRQNIYANYKNKKKSLAQWAEDLNIPYWTLRRRYSQGYTIREIVKEFS